MKMVYPNLANKYVEKALFSPKGFVNWKKFKLDENDKPKKYILVYYPGILNYFKRNYRLKKINLYRLIRIYQHKDIGVVQMTGIGAPNATAVMEELIALGGKEFINMGSAGGLENFGTYLCTKALRDEGTSHHYAASGDYAYPDGSLTNRLRKSMMKNKIKFEEGPTWTIDAPYRETVREVEHYRKQGVKTVEMEASALFVLAKYRKVKIASAFVVSDLLGKKWEPKFGARFVHRSLNQLFESAMDCFSK